MIIHWHRTDLRIEDNPALDRAAELARQRGTTVQPVFVFDPQFYSEESLACDARIEFMHDLPRYFTTVAYDESYGDAGVFIEKVPALRELRSGSDAVAVDERIAPRGTERVISKKYASAFFGTDLATGLVTDSVDTLVLCGVTTSGCVRATAVDGLQYGYRVIVPRDAAGDRAEGPHCANLFDIDAKYGDLVTTGDVLVSVDELRE